MNGPLYDGAKAVFNVLFRILWRMRVYGKDNVPRAGGVIIASNHISYMDPPLLGSASPRRLQYMAKQELFSIPLLGPAIRAVGAYPVDRKGSAKSAIKRSIDVLKAGGAIGIYPEGTRNRDGSHDPQVGVALLAQLSGAPVVPAYLENSRDPMKFKAVRVYFGQPMRVPQSGKLSRTDLEEFARDVMQEIRSLPEAYHR